ncbi:MAG: DedA family protein, partial [Deferribacterales bacterium]|nr:DedA family protein [Deferribacterales bacterium]
MDKIVAFIVASIGGMGYIGIVLLMALESSFFPFPSEVVVPPAGYLASQGEMNIFLVILSGILGSILGAFVNYYIAYKYGRNLLITYGKYFFINEEKFKKIESFFITHGEISTFVGRLIPGVRQYISFPAGLAKMNLTKFIFYTALGAGIWVVILAYVGYFIGNNIELIREKLHIITIIII